MHSLAVRDCTVTFQAFYTPARIFESLNLGKLAESLLNEFSSYNILATDISLDRGDGVYAYALRITLFNDLLSARVTATTLECSFKRLLRRADRDIAASCIQRLVRACGEGLGERGYVEVGLHGSFASQPERDNFFSQNKPNDYKWGGILAYKELGAADQMIRIEVDQSWVFPDAAFVSWRTIGLRLDQILADSEPWQTLFNMLPAFDISLNDE